MAQKVGLARLRLQKLSALCWRRVPSGCLPIVTCVGECVYGPAQKHKAQMHVHHDQLILCLKKRKNRWATSLVLVWPVDHMAGRPLGSRLHRQCWCDKSMSTCPLHILGCFYRWVQCMAWLPHLHMCNSGHYLWALPPLQSWALPGPWST